jgi:hypothetical protein
MPISVDVWLSDTFVSAICAQSERNSLPLPSLLSEVARMELMV